MQHRLKAYADRVYGKLPMPLLDNCSYIVFGESDEEDAIDTRGKLRHRYGSQTTINSQQHGILGAAFPNTHPYRLWSDPAREGENCRSFLLNHGRNKKFGWGNSC